MKARRTLKTALTIGAVATTVAHAGTAHAVAGGTEDDADNFPFVVAIRVENPNTNKVELCSATVITPTWLLTASHCVADQGLGSSCGVAEGSHFFNGDMPIEVYVDAQAPHDSDGNLIGAGDFSHRTGASGLVFSRQAFFDICSTLGSARDIALIQLDRRIPLSPQGGIPPLHPSLNGISRCRDFVPDYNDLRLTMIGYGGLPTSAGSTTGCTGTSTRPTTGSSISRTRQITNGSTRTSGPS